MRDETNNQTDTILSSSAQPQPSGSHNELNAPGHAPYNQLPPTDDSKDYERLGRTLLAERERSTRPYAYVGLTVLCGYIAQLLYNAWLSTAYSGWNDEQYQLWADSQGWSIISILIGAAIAIVGLKIYFHRKDKKYKQLNKQ